ncbi:MAG: hypothetical protein Q7R84_01005 [bacterium]|nr:hypothetical protein [bacterium]
MTQAQEGSTHPVMEKEISYIRSWGRWKELWEKTTEADILHSLLHIGFAVPVDEGETVDRILWYLNMADKRKSYFNFRKNEDKDLRFQRIIMGGKEINNFEDIRLLLVQKAFQALCQNFFKNTGKEHNNHWWLPMVLDPQVLEKLFWFFRLDEDGRFFNRQHPEDHNTLIVAEFIRNVCEFIWNYEDSYSRWGVRFNDEIIEALRQARPNTITILFGLKELDFLFNLERHHGLNVGCMKRLKKLAMGFDLYLPSPDASRDAYRKPLTIEEACFGGSQAARVLISLRVIQAEKGRFCDIRELESQRREVEERLKKVRKD